jgi:hypothetical protein
MIISGFGGFGSLGRSFFTVFQILDHNGLNGHSRPLLWGHQAEATPQYSPETPSTHDIWGTMFWLQICQPYWIVRPLILTGLLIQPKAGWPIPCEWPAGRILPVGGPTELIRLYSLLIGIFPTLYHEKMYLENFRYYPFLCVKCTVKFCKSMVNLY